MPSLNPTQNWNALSHRLLGSLLVILVSSILLPLRSRAQDIGWKIAMDVAARAVREERYEGAEESYKGALESARLPSGEVQPYAATTLNDLAVLYHIQPKFGQAEPLYLQALTVREHEKGKSDPSLLAILDNLGSAYCSDGKYEQSRTFFERAHAIPLGPLLPKARPASLHFKG